jgi:hypothetical protein
VEEVLEFSADELALYDEWFRLRAEAEKAAYDEAERNAKRKR